MSDVEEEAPRGTTRMQRLREELEHEQQARAALVQQVGQLESQLREMATEVSTEKEETQDKSTADTNEEPLLTTVQPLNEEGLHSLTRLYQSMGESQRLQSISLSRPKNFSGMEVVEDPYALTHWYREVACWVQGYATDPLQQVVLALQTLTGTARIIIDNIIMSDAKKVQDLMSLFHLLKETFQRRDPGPDAWKEFQRARLRINKENVVSFLNRLLLLSFVINMSEDPTCPSVNEGDIATKLRVGLPYQISNQMEQHMQLMVDLGRTPDVSPWGIAATALKIEAQEREKARVTARVVRTPESRVSKAQTVATVHALPQSNSAVNSRNNIRSGRATKRFSELSEFLQKRIVEVQKELQDLPLGATLTSEQQQRCRSNSLCLKCRRYGHDAVRCHHTSPMVPKN